jgi:acyl transferase domain-containing protein
MAPGSEEPRDAVEDLAGVIGFACRVPGAASPRELWKAIDEQKDLRSEIPKDRFNVDAFYHPVGSMKGRVRAVSGD